VLPQIAEVATKVMAIRMVTTLERVSGRWREPSPNCCE
jgi:hypothetical protein